MSDGHRDINITLNTGTIVKFFVIAVFVAVLYFLSDIVLVVLTAVIIASSIEPVVRRMQRHGVHRVVSVVSVYVIVALILAAFLVIFLPTVAGDMVSFLNNLPKNVSLGDIWRPIGGFDAGSFSQTLSDHTISVSDFVKGMQSLIVDTSSGAFKTASSLFGGFLSFILIMVLSFYLAVQKDGVDDFLRIIAPVRHHEYIIDLWKRSQRKIGLWLQGQIVLGIVVGVLVYLVLMIVGIPYALMLALFAALFEIIPVFGPVISSIPAILIAFSEKGVGTGFLLIGLYLIIYQFESQLFYPLVVKKIVGISPIVVILALIIGAKLAGLLGAVIAVPLSAAFMEYIHDIEKYKKAEVAERAIIGKNPS